MEHIGISVIVPIYNTKPYLKECVDSILKQEVEVPFEVLLVDDGATDGCAEMCDEFAAKDKRVRVFHQENQGLSAARNTGHRCRPRPLLRLCGLGRCGLPRLPAHPVRRLREK